MKHGVYLTKLNSFCTVLNKGSYQYCSISVLSANEGCLIECNLICDGIVALE